MSRKKTNGQFTKEVYELVGDEYTFIEDYVGSQTKIEVVHNKCGNKYEVRPYSFLLGRRCPGCSSKSRWTDEIFKKKVKEEVGDEYTFLETYVKTHTKLDVVHNTCGNKYGVTPANFLYQDSRCPACSSNRRWTNEMFVEKVKEEVGDEYTFLESYVNSDTKIEVVHNKCGNRYSVRPSSFLGGSRCVSCYLKSITCTDEMFVERVKEEVGDEYTFLGPYENSHTKLEVVHNTCGNRYEVTPTMFFSGRRCPACYESKGERKIADHLNKLGIIFKREKTFSDLKVINSLRYDFAVYHKGELVTLIEYDGELHFVAVELFGGEGKLLKIQEHDRIKNEYAKENNIPLLRIPYTEFDNIEEILDRYLSDHF